MDGTVPADGQMYIPLLTSPLVPFLSAGEVFHQRRTYKACNPVIMNMGCGDTSFSSVVVETDTWGGVDSKFKPTF